jgi:hypothetical protein
MERKVLDIPIDKVPREEVEEDFFQFLEQLQLRMREGKVLNDLNALLGDGWTVIGIVIRANKMLVSIGK